MLSLLSAGQGQDVIVWDVDALAFIAATGITDMLQKIAVNNLCTSMKTAGIWVQMLAVYPFVGGTATTCKFNLMKPLDTDAAYRLTFGGGITFATSGVTPNGTNGYADTHLNLLSKLPAYNLSFGYTSTTARTSENSSQIGCIDTTQPSRYTANLWYSAVGAKFASMGAYPVQSPSSTNNNTIGTIIGSRTSNTYASLFFNGSRLSVITATSAVTNTNLNAFVFAANQNGSATEYTGMVSTFAFVGTGLNDTDAANFSSIITNYNTYLGR